MGWQLWQAGPIECQVERISPLLASWEKSTHPAQVRLRAYLDELLCKLLPLPQDGPIFLQLDVDVQDPEKLLRHYDLENYLTPLFGSRCLPAARFFFVTATKCVGGGSTIAWGKAIPAQHADDDGWTSFTINAGRGASHKSWKERICIALQSTHPIPITPGPACVRLGWRCASRRNWCTLWKPTGDAMGPVLGVANELRPYHLNDDRIVDLEFHRNVDDALGHDVEVGMWWRAASPSRKRKVFCMSATVFQTDDEYQRWRQSHPHAFVLNTTRPESPRYMVLHRASCKYISEPLHEKTSGGFTERDYQKIGAENIESLHDWVAVHGRLDRTFSNECRRCNPTT